MKHGNAFRSIFLCLSSLTQLATNQRVPFVYAAFLLSLSSPIFSQTPGASPVQDLKVTYAIQSNPDSIPLVLPQTEITLSTTSGIQKVYLKILDQADSLIYTVNYLLNAAPVTNGSGVTLFATSVNRLTINSPNIIRLNTYTYQVITEDASGNQATPYTKIQ